MESVVLCNDVPITQLHVPVSGTICIYMYIYLQNYIYIDYHFSQTFVYLLSVVNVELIKPSLTNCSVCPLINADYIESAWKPYI